MSGRESLGLKTVEGSLFVLASKGADQYFFTLKTPNTSTNIKFETKNNLYLQTAPNAAKAIARSLKGGFSLTYCVGAATSTLWQRDR